MRIRWRGRQYAFAERMPQAAPTPPLDESLSAGATAGRRPRQPDFSEIGFFGTKIFAGIPEEEYNPLLTGIEARRIYDQMRRSDGQVQAILLAVTLPIRSATWFVQPNRDGGAAAQEMADAVEANLFGGMRYSFDDFLREALLHLVFGFSVFEKVWRMDKGRIVLDKFAPRVAPSVWRWPQDANYDVAEVEQINYVTGQMVRIPLWKCRVLTHWREGDNPEGISMLRAAYKHWLIKDALLRIINIGVERSLVGVPVGTIPRGASAEDITLFKGIVQNLRIDEHAGVTMPEGFLLDLLEGKRTAVDALPYVSYHDEQIARSVLAQWIGLGSMSQGGSMALSQDQTDMFLMSVDAEATYFEQEVQRDISELCAYNDADPRLVPTLRHKDLGYRDMTKFSTALHNLMGNRTPLLTIDDGLEDYVRDLMGLPEITPEQRAKAQAQELAAQSAAAMAPGQNVALLPDNGDPDPGAAPVPQAGARPQDPNQPVRQPRTQGGQPKEEFAAGERAPAVRLAEPPRRRKRPLTPYEHAGHLDALERQIEGAEAELLARLAGIVQRQGDDWIQRLQKVLALDVPAAGKLRAIGQIPVRYRGQMAAELRSYLTEVAQQAAHQARAEIEDAAGRAAAPSAAPGEGHALEPGAGAAAQPVGPGQAPEPPGLPPAAAAAIQVRADTLAQAQAEQLEMRLKLAATRAVETGDSPARAVHAVRQEAQAAQDSPALKATATISVGQAVGAGRSGAAMASRNVQAAQWSAILDEHTCPLCESLDGRIVDIHDPDYDRFQPPLHTRCRCVWIYIDREEQGVQRTWQTPDPALVDAHANLLI